MVETERATKDGAVYLVGDPEDIEVALEAAETAEKQDESEDSEVLELGRE